ncbi:MAG: repeat protein [Rhodocyclales bacterium]|nr:repeat protein [Rhodocyclales bacterium]
MKVILNIAVLLFLACESFAALGQAEHQFDYYKEAGQYPTRDYLNQSFSEQIDPFSGRLQVHTTDLRIPGNGGFEIAIQRSYTSVDDSVAGSVTPFGYGWTIHFGRVLRKVNNGLCAIGSATGSVMPSLELPDGSRQTLYKDDIYVSGGLISLQRWRAECIPGGSGLKVFSPDGTQYIMTTLGSAPAGMYAYYTTQIIDRNNNVATIGYTNFGGITVPTSVTSDGRSVTLAYTSSGADLRLESIKDNGTNRTWIYDYKKVSGLWLLTKVTPPVGGAWQYDYKESGPGYGVLSLSKMTYPQSGYISYTYDRMVFFSGSGSIENTVVKSKVTSDGYSWGFAYQPSNGPGINDVTTVTTPEGVVTYKHIGFSTVVSGTLWKVGLLVEKKQQSINALQTETYTWIGQQISTQDNPRPGNTLYKDLETTAPILSKKVVVRDGGTYTTDYLSPDLYGNPTQISESSASFSRTTSLTYQINTTKWIIHQEKDRSFDGYSITRNIDGNGNITQENKFGVITNYAYEDGQGNRTRLTNARGKVWTFTNYYRGIPKNESHPEGVNIVRVVSPAGNVTSETDGAGHTIGYGYDDLNRVTSINYPIGNDVTIAYIPTKTTLTRGGYTEAHNFDGFGRITSVVRPGITTTFQNDALGRRTFESYPGSALGTITAYDILGRPQTITNGDATKKTFSYLDHQISITNERSKTATYTYRALGDPDTKELMSIAYASDPSLNQIFGRNLLGQLTSVTQGTKARSYGYDTRGYLLTVTEPETGVTTLGRDAVGNMTSRYVSNALGTSPATTFTYDGLNRLTDILYPAGTPSVNKTYYKDDTVWTVGNGTASRTYTYDSNKNLKVEQVTIGPKSYAIGYNYGGNDGLDNMTYPSGLGVNYSADIFGRPSKALPFVTSVGYHPTNEPSSISYANGVATTTTLKSNRPWLQGINAVKGASIVNLNYLYDGLANVTSITDGIDSTNNVTADYDAIDRLTVANTPGANINFSYDATGNIGSQTIGSSTLNYTYDAGTNKLTGISGSKTYNFSYDVYGNVTANGSKSFTYNDASLMTSVVGGATHAYDGDGMRVTTTDVAGQKTYYLYTKGGSLLAEETFAADGAPVSVKEYAYLLGKQIAVRQDLDPHVTSTTTLTLSPAAPALGQAVTLTSTVSGFAPTGSVTFYDNGTAIGTIPLAGATASLSGYIITAGAHSFTATYSGNPKNTVSTSAAAALSVSQAAPSLALSAAPASIHKGEALSISATLAGAYNPTGSVSFTGNGAPLASTPVSGGVATLSTSGVPVGTLVLSANYSGDANNSAATATATVTINVLKAISSTALAASPPGTAIKGRPVSFTATVTGYTPTGSVVFKVDGIAQGAPIALSSGTATFTTSSLTPGNHTLTAEYSGDSQNEASIVSITQRVTDPAVLVPILQMLLD